MFMETYEPYSGPEQCWAAAGWFVYVQTFGSTSVQKATACHKATGRIVQININTNKSKNFSEQSWDHQGLNALMKPKQG